MTALINDRLAGLSLQQLQSFCEVCERKSYAETARHLGLAVPTVWEQVKSLERAYGVVLFQRDGRRMQPTAAADQLYEIVQPVIERMDSTAEQIGATTTRTPDSISVAAGMRMLIEDFGRPLKLFQAEYPEIRLRLIGADNQRAQDDVADGIVDVAFMLEPPPQQARRNLQYEFAYAIDYLAAFPRSHPLARKKSLSIQDLVKHRLIIGHGETVGRQLLDQTLYREGLLAELQIAAETDNSAITIACVHAGMGVGIVGGNPQGPLMKQIAFVSLRQHLGQARIVSVVRKGRLLSSAVRRLQSLMSEAAS